MRMGLPEGNLRFTKVAEGAMFVQHVTCADFLEYTQCSIV